MRYYGITVGPIHETISSVTKPAGLWMASYFFSCITRDLCKEILDIDSKKVTIISPYFENGDETKGKDDGIGRYHDRIIFIYFGNEEDAFEKKLEDTFLEIKRLRAIEIAKCLDKSEADVIDYINKYIYIRCIGVSEIADNNALKTLSSKLDVLELMESVRPSGNARFISSVLSSNERVKKYKECSLVNPTEMSGGFAGISKVLTKKSGAIKEIESIAQGDGSISDYKISNYFAVVYADGDHMGTVVETLGNEFEGISPEERQKEFSRHCLEYTSESAKLINQYGGITIYAGGDDLLFLAPLRNKEKTVFDLCQDITDKFNSTFKEERDILKEQVKDSDEDLGPSLSYGISINYFRYPLYEAVEDAKRLLFDVAKYENKDKDEGEIIKRIYNSIALDVRKASGQKVEMVLKQGTDDDSSMKQMLDVLRSFINKSESKDGERHGIDISELANSAIFTLENQKRVISKIWSGKVIREKRATVLDNFFDSDSQKRDTALLCKLGDAIASDKSKEMIRIKNVAADDEAFVVSGITSVLRVCKFFVEKGDEGR